MPWGDDDYRMGGEGYGEGGGTVISDGGSCYFAEGEYGIKLFIFLHRAHPEDNPGAKPEVQWSYAISGAGERPNWSIDGNRIVHSGDKKINASSDLGKMLAAAKEAFPEPPRPVDPQDASWWEKLLNLGETEWTWVTEPKRKQNEDGKWVVDHDAKPNSRLVPVRFLGEEGDFFAPDESETLDLASLGLSDEDLAAFKTAVADVDDYTMVVEKAMPFLPKSSTLVGVMGDPKRTKALLEALHA